MITDVCFPFIFLFPTEVLLEPMLKFAVKSVSKQDELTLVVLEPVEQPLLLEDSVPPGCIQHIVSELTKNKDSKVACDGICDILCGVYMDDNASRKGSRFRKQVSRP